MVGQYKVELEDFELTAFPALRLQVQTTQHSSGASFYSVVSET